MVTRLSKLIIDDKKMKKINGKYVAFSDLSELHKKLKKQNKKVVFTAGAWDLLHVGQMRYLEESKKQGDILVVGVLSNDAIKAVKGKNKPILDEKVRAESLIYLRSVDYVTIIPDTSCQPALGLLKPDVYITVQEDWNKDYKESKEYKTVADYGGQVKLVDRQSPYITTSKIIQRVIGSHLGDSFKKYMNVRKKPLKEK